jgi:hypothetical protein
LKLFHKIEVQLSNAKSYWNHLGVCAENFTKFEAFFTEVESFLQMTIFQNTGHNSPCTKRWRRWPQRAVPIFLSPIFSAVAVSCFRRLRKVQPRLPGAVRPASGHLPLPDRVVCVGRRLPLQAGQAAGRQGLAVVHQVTARKRQFLKGALAETFRRR